MEYLKPILETGFSLYQTISSVLASISTAQGFALFVIFLFIAPRILLFISGRIAKFFKKPRLIVRAFNGELNPNSDNLIILVSGVRAPKILLWKTENTIKSGTQNCDILKLRIDNAIISNSSPYEIASQINDLINAQFEKKSKTGSKYKKVQIVTHSLGALLVRKAVLFASKGFGKGRKGFENHVCANDSNWRNALERIIFLGGIHSGFSRNCEFRFGFFALMLEFMGIGKLILSCETGTPFVETLRQEWIDLTRNPHGKPAPICIQIEGDSDWAIPDDNLQDLEAQIANEISPNLYALEIGGTAHFSILDMSLIEDGELSLVTRRANILIEALSLKPSELKEISLVQSNIEIKSQLEERAKIKRLIIVHEDRNQKDAWIETIQQAAFRMFGENDEILVCRETPQRVSRFSFLLDIFGRRRKSLQWFGALCTSLKAQYPYAGLSIIAINNGTWVVANTLSKTHSLKIETMFLVGSILPREFAWDRIVNQGRLGLLCNALSHEDLFCAIIGGFYEWLGRNLPFINRIEFFSFGDSGFGGFNWLGEIMGEIAYIEGTSDAFLESRSSVRFATAFAAFGGPIEEANILATQGYKAISHETDPENINPNAIVTSDYIGDAAKIVKFLNRFAWGAGSALLIAIIGVIFGMALFIYQMIPVYSSVAIIAPIIFIVLLLDSL
ncbi:MAG: hypothetical protein LCH83_00595 [Proteobacteria bacterium]|nr:hypothetical protein [Pseudomonadota bacterium]